MKDLPSGFRLKDNGQYEYRFSVSGRRRSVSGSSVRDCRAKAQELITRDAGGLLADRSALTLKEYAEEVIRRSQVKPTTRISYTHWLGMLPGWLLDMRLQKIERRHIIAAQAELAKTAAVATVNSVISLVGQICKEAVLDDVLPKSPCTGVRTLKAAPTQARDTIHRALTLDEQKRLFDALRDNWYLEVFELQMLTGMRIGEVAALRWADVSGQAINVHATISAGSYSDTPKTDSSRRQIPITPAIRKVLLSQRSKMMSVHGVASVGKGQQVFRPLRTDSEYIRQSVVNRSLGCACKAIGLDKISSHAFRDTFATRAIEQGMPPNTLKELLGHKSITMTMDLYAHVLPDTKVEAMQKLNIMI